jgi:F-type H+-transporting ATPase subunit c
VNKYLTFVTTLVVVLIGGSTASAAEVPLLESPFGAGIGAGLVVIGAAMGIGRLASSAYESMARQPEVAGNVQTAMIIAAALIEGFTFFGLYICMLAAQVAGFAAK